MSASASAVVSAPVPATRECGALKSGLKLSVLSMAGSKGGAAIGLLDSCRRTVARLSLGGGDAR